MAKNNIDLSVVLHDTSDYKDWLVELKERFYSHRLKASCATNGYLLDFYWKLGRDIEAKQYANTYGSGFYKNLSQDLKNEMPGVKGFSPINLRYMVSFSNSMLLYIEIFRRLRNFSLIRCQTQMFRKLRNNLKDVNSLLMISRCCSPFLGTIIAVSLTNVRMIWTKPCSLQERHGKITGDVMHCLIGSTHTYMSVMAKLLQISNLHFLLCRAI